MEEFLQKIHRRAGFEFKRIVRRPFKRFINPFESKNNNPLIIHCCYHRGGTLWFRRILRDITAEFGLSFQACKQDDLSSNTDVFLQNHSRINLEKLPNYIGSHMIRDPRDVVVSRYFYHLWTKEKWANIPRDELNGKSYKEYLNSLSQNDGLLEEIKRAKTWISSMTNWNYNNPRIFEIKYEDIILNEEKILHKLFQHYGFKASVVERSCQIARKYSFQKITKRKRGEAKQRSHLRSGQSGQWANYFTEEHKKVFKSLYPDVLVTLGYEKDDGW